MGATSSLPSEVKCICECPKTTNNDSIENTSKNTRNVINSNNSKISVSQQQSYQEGHNVRNNNTKNSNSLLKENVRPQQPVIQQSKNKTGFVQNMNNLMKKMKAMKITSNKSKNNKQQKMSKSNTKSKNTSKSSSGGRKSG